jgi:hypothetical protein
MYCSTCGASIVPGLSYCNQCGAKLTEASSKQSPKSSEVRPESLIWAMVAVLVFGFVAIVFLMLAMKMVGLNEGQILGFTLLSFLIMLLLEGVFIWQLLRRKRGGQEPGDSGLTGSRATQELDATEPRYLSEPVASVTENTTRTFDPVYSERRPK